MIDDPPGGVGAVPQGAVAPARDRRREDRTGDDIVRRGAGVVPSMLPPCRDHASGVPCLECGTLLYGPLTVAPQLDILGSVRADREELARLRAAHARLRHLAEQIGKQLKAAGLNIENASPLQHHGPCGFWKGKPCTCPIRKLTALLAALTAIPEAPT